MKWMRKNIRDALTHTHTHMWWTFKYWIFNRMFRFNRVFNHAYTTQNRCFPVAFHKFSVFYSTSPALLTDLMLSFIWCTTLNRIVFEGHLTWNDWYTRFCIITTCWFLLDIDTRSLWQHSFFHFYWFIFNVKRIWKSKNFHHLHNGSEQRTENKKHTIEPLISLSCLKVSKLNIGCSIHSNSTLIAWQFSLFCSLLCHFLI